LTAEAEDTPTDLRHDLDYLKRMLEVAIRLHRPANMEEATMLANIQGYFMYLCMKGLNSPSLARELVKIYAQLQAWLETMYMQTPVWKAEHEIIRFYMGFLFALEQFLSLKHEIKRLPSEAVSREDFMRSWRQTAKKLGLS